MGRQPQETDESLINPSCKYGILQKAAAPEGKEDITVHWKGIPKLDILETILFGISLFLLSPRERAINTLKIIERLRKTYLKHSQLWQNHRIKKEEEMKGNFNFDMASFISFRDQAECERVRKIKKEDFFKHPNKNFRIRSYPNKETMKLQFVLHIVAGIKKSLDEKKQHVIILPAWCFYPEVADLINQLNIPCHHVHTFNMDEFADQDGKAAPREWPFSFQNSMWKMLFDRIKPELKIPEKQIHFPSEKNVNDYSRMIEDLGGADVCYGGIGWSGHIAFFEPHLGDEFGNDIQAYLKAGTRLVELHPMTIMQNALFLSKESGDWSAHPPKAYTIGPRELAGSKLVSFWCGFSEGAAKFQRFITRLSAHGPVTPYVPASILQVTNSELVVSDQVAEDCYEDNFNFIF